MTNRFSFDYEFEFEIYDRLTEKHYDGRVGHQKELCKLLNQLSDENEQLKKENGQLHQKIFEQRTRDALDRTEISKETYMGKKTSKEYLNSKEFLNEMEKW